jgi:hypothetical protein
MTQCAQSDNIQNVHRAKIFTPILAVVVAAVAVLAVPGVPKFVNLRATNSETAQVIAIDIWRLHLQVDVDRMPVLTVADPV